MKKLYHLTYSCTNAMFSYLKGNEDVIDLIGYLRMYEETTIKENGGENKGLSFKFGINDSLCTTIDDIENDLNLPSSHNNHKLMVEKMESVIGLNPDDELIVSYS